MRKLITVIGVAVTLTSCIHQIQVKGVVIDKAITYNKYGSPSFYTIVKTETDGVRRVYGEDDYYSTNKGDTVTISILK